MATYVIHRWLFIDFKNVKKKKASLCDFTFRLLKCTLGVANRQISWNRH